jgi:hypothetical protein
MMVMKKLFTIAAALAFIPALAMAAPDFSGTWVRDNANSSAVPGSMYWLTRGVEAGGARSPQSNAITLQVKQSGANLELVDPTDPVRNFVLDGKPYTVKTDTGVVDATVTSTLTDSGLTIVTRRPWGGMPGNVDLTESRNWTLSPDGKTLTVTIVRDTPAKRDSYKEIYTKR